MFLVASVFFVKAVGAGPVSKGQRSLPEFANADGWIKLYKLYRRDKINRLATVESRMSTFINVIRSRKVHQPVVLNVSAKYSPAN